MLGLLCDSYKTKTIKAFGSTILLRISSPISNEIFGFGPFNSNTQKRWKKPVVTAQTRLEDRTRDLKFEKLMSQLKRMKIVLRLHEVMSKRRSHHVSVQSLSKCRNFVGLNTTVGVFLRKYPHIFEIYIHPFKRSLCCKLTETMTNLIEEEAIVVKESEAAAVQRLKKLLMISTSGTLHIHALWLVRREIGLPDDFRQSLLPKYTDDFCMVNPEIVALVSRDDCLAVAEVEKWREKEYDEKWLSEFETKYAFQIHFPTGFKIEKGFREKLKNWQRLRYIKPYEKTEVIRVRTQGGVERFEKRAVGILHEFLSLTVEKMIPIERLSHFRKDFNMEVNIRELLLKHPGVFYISTKGNIQTVFLREAYSKGCLIQPNPIYTVRRKMLELLLLRCRNTRQLQRPTQFKERDNGIVCSEVGSGPRDGDWVIPILECFDDQTDGNMSNDSDTSDVEIDEKSANSEILNECVKG